MSEQNEFDVQDDTPEAEISPESQPPAAAIMPDPIAPPPAVPEPVRPVVNTVAMQDADVERQMHRLSRRSFLWAGAALIGGYTGWQWLISRRADNGVPWPFRRALEIDEQFARDYFRPTRLAPTFPRALAREPKPNGDEGLNDDFDPAAWKLHVEGANGADEPLTLTLADIQALPRVEMTTELKCIEGWSVVVHWVGARFADFAAKYPPPTRDGGSPDVKDHPEDLVDYVGMETPDGGYYIGLDMPSALHPQTLLCYEMNGQPLTSEHGAPLRLVIPVKYGIKHIKRIGTIRYASERPKDFWAEQGYDWYAGH
jgi:hypothetical protein